MLTRSALTPLHAAAAAAAAVTPAAADDDDDAFGDAADYAVIAKPMLLHS